MVRPSHALSKSLRRGTLLSLFGLLAISGCALVPLRLDPGQYAEIRLKLAPGGEPKLIELRGRTLGPYGAELELTVGSVQLPPVYFPPEPWHDGPSEKYSVAQPWSPQWPSAPGGQARITNYGPSSVRLRAPRIVRGSWSEVFSEGRRWQGRWPMSGDDLIELVENEVYDSEVERTVAFDVPSYQRWRARQNRRLAFEFIDGVALPMRMVESVIDDVEVRSARLSGGGAVVAFSRRPHSKWRAPGPGWFPEAAEARWIEIPARRPLPRGFQSEGRLFSFAIYVGAAARPPAAPEAEPSSSATAGAGGGELASLSAKLFRLDTVRPVAARQWDAIAPEGRWLDFPLAEPQEPGQFVLELTARAGSPLWLAWNREREAIEGSDFTVPVETLLLHEGPAESRPLDRVAVAAQVTGEASRVIRYPGTGADREQIAQRISEGELVLEADLAPGDTEIYYLPDYYHAIGRGR